MTDEDPGPFPDRRGFAFGALGTSAYVEACGAYTARCARLSLLEMRLLRKAIEEALHR